MDAAKFRHGAVVTIQTKGGQRYTSTDSTPRGPGARGTDRADIDAKYRALVAMANPDTAKIESSLNVIHEFRDVQQVSMLTNLLR